MAAFQDWEFGSVQGSTRKADFGSRFSSGGLTASRRIAAASPVSAGAHASPWDISTDISIPTGAPFCANTTRSQLPASLDRPSTGIRAGIVPVGANCGDVGLISVSAYRV